MKTKQIETEHVVTDETSLRLALANHHATARAAGIEAASARQPTHTELVSLIDGRLIIRTTTEEICVPREDLVNWYAYHFKASARFSR